MPPVTVSAQIRLEFCAALMQGYCGSAVGFFLRSKFEFAVAFHFLDCITEKMMMVNPARPVITSGTFTAKLVIIIVAKTPIA